jgi:hypothetical protein
VTAVPDAQVNKRDTELAAIPRARLLTPTARIKDQPRAQDIAVVLAVRCMEGVIDPEVSAWLRSALLRWRRHGGNLITHLHLPSANRFRLACRDLWLVDASRFCPGTAWQRTHLLQAEISRFMAYRWAAWQRQDEMPTGAGAIEARLFLACKSHPKLPRSRRALYRIILTDAFSADDDTTQEIP